MRDVSARGCSSPPRAIVDPREAMRRAAPNALLARGGEIRFGADRRFSWLPARTRIVDCRGFAARDALPELRGVRGEMMLVRTREVRLDRVVRFLHPRIPLYIVPRGGGDIHDRRDDDRKRRARPRHRSVRDRNAERRLCAASGFRRSGDRRDERRRASGLPRQRAAHRRARRPDFHQRALSPRLSAVARARGSAAALAFQRTSQPSAARPLVEAEPCG